MKLKPNLPPSPEERLAALFKAANDEDHYSEALRIRRTSVTSNLK